MALRPSCKPGYGFSSDESRQAARKTAKCRYVAMKDTGSAVGHAVQQLLRSSVLKCKHAGCVGNRLAIIQTCLQVSTALAQMFATVKASKRATRTANKKHAASAPAPGTQVGEPLLICLILAHLLRAVGVSLARDLTAYKVRIASCIVAAA